MCALILKHNHPFIGGLKNYPEGKRKDVQKIRSWMTTQPHMPDVSEEFIYLFLHACYYSHEKTKNAIECWFTIRASHPTIFENRDPLEPKMKNLLDMGFRREEKVGDRQMIGDLVTTVLSIKEFLYTRRKDQFLLKHLFLKIKVPKTNKNTM